MNSNRLHLIAMVLVVMGWGVPARAESDVTVVSAPTAGGAPSQKDVAPDGTPVVHKSLHKKKASATATAASGTGAPSAAANASPAATENKPAQKPAMMAVVSVTYPQSPATTMTQPPAVAPANAASARNTPVSNPVRPFPTTAVNPSAPVPSIETGMPVARYPGMGAPIKGVSTYLPAATHQTLFASTVPASVIPLTSSSAGSYASPAARTTGPASDFVLTNTSKKPKNNYSWRTGIITTMFWIGEGSTPVSSTTNVQSSWDEDWLPNNHGSDSPYNRNGYAAGAHASTLNPFYVALPFNDLAFPDKARQWLPSGWYRRPKDGKQVSACKDRWVEIKNAAGRICYAQWEDVGPLRFDHAEYVFGSERPIGLGDNHAGLDVSPAVAQYLGIDGKNRMTSWRFVDDEDVRPGDWLRLDEQAVLYTALHQMKNTGLPTQRATEPIGDPSNIDSNKKKVDASKG